MDPNTAIYEQLCAWLHAHAADLIADLAALVRIPSIVGQEQAAQAFMQRQYQALGLQIDVFEPNAATLRTHAAFVDSGILFAGRNNLVATQKAARSGGRSLILNGHADVVSAEPTAAWHYPPFDAHVVSTANSRYGRMYGRGTQDMKAGLIANLYAVKALQDCEVALRGDLILQSVLEEEAGGGGGTLACFERGYLADGFIASEPHWLDVLIAHPGVLYFRIIVEGKAAHAGRAHQGINAAVELAPIVTMLGAWDRERAESKHYELFERSDPGARRSCHLNVGVLRAGDWPSTVPGRAECDVRMSFVPGESEAAIRAEIAARVQVISQHSAWLSIHPPKIEFFGWHTDPWIQDEQHPFVQSFVEVVHAVRGGTDALPVPMGMTAATDARFAGLYNVPAFCWGPKGANLHGADEYVELDSVISVASTLAAFCCEWCGVAA